MDMPARKFSIWLRSRERDDLDAVAEENPLCRWRARENSDRASDETLGERVRNRAAVPQMPESQAVVAVEQETSA